MRLAVLALVLITSLVPPTVTAGERKAGSAPARRFKLLHQSNEPAPAQLPSLTDQHEWTRPKTLRNSDQHLPWNAPRYVGIERIHRDQPSFLEPPARLKSIDVPSSVADPGEISKASHLEPLTDSSATTQPEVPDDVEPTTTIPFELNPPRRNDIQSESQDLASVAEAQHVQSIDGGDAAAHDDSHDTGVADLEALIAAEADSPTPDDQLDEPPTGADLIDADAAEPFVEEGVDPIPPIDEQVNSVPADTPLAPDEMEPRAMEAFTVETAQESLEDLLGPDTGPQPTEEDTPDSSILQNDATRAPETMELPSPPTNDVREAPYDFSMYADRDCPAIQATYQQAWQAFQSRSISQISLDITPAFEPNEDDLLIAARHQREKLATSPSRVWRDRDGKQVAEGRLTDYRYGQVWIDTDKGRKSVPFQELSNEDLCFVSAWWGIPTEFHPPADEYQIRDWTLTTFTWKASGVCHKPLYFEDVELERYGHTAGPVKQVALSGAHFFGNIFFLPYHLGLNPPNECQYALGYYRPGNCAPWLVPAVPLNARAFRMQVGTLTGGIALIP
jgi:hypothetical protein